MTTPDESKSKDMVVVAAFGLEDLHRLHALLVCYESPFSAPGEEANRRRDVREHERLRRYLASLMEDLPVRWVIRLK